MKFTFLSWRLASEPPQHGRTHAGAFLYKSRYYTHCHRVQHGMRNLTCRNVRSGICVQIHARPCLKHGSRAIQLCDVGAAAAICFSMLASIPAKSDDWDRLVGCTPRRQDHARRRVRVIASGLARRVCGSVPAPRAVPLVLGWLEVEVVDEVIKEEAALPMPPSSRVAREPDGAVRRDHHRLLRVPRRGALKHRRWLAKGSLVLPFGTPKFTQPGCKRWPRIDPEPQC